MDETLDNHGKMGEVQPSAHSPNSGDGLALDGHAKKGLAIYKITSFRSPRSIIKTQQCLCLGKGSKHSQIVMNIDDHFIFSREETCRALAFPFGDCDQ